MTQAMHRHSPEGQDKIDSDILAGLWEQAAFPRLPRDAPALLEDLVEDVDNPKRVYTIHRASRRHNFQLLVQRFIVQLRDGCGSSTCDTPSCLTCRKRLVGKGPIRRYNTTSARMIAVFLASQDNPESALCPCLRPTRTAPATLDSLVFAAKHPKGHSRTAQPKVHPTPEAGRKHARKHGAAQDKAVGDGDAAQAHDQVALTEQPVSKDYRSFAANMFGTVAFKMLEWLTPAGLEEMSRRASLFNGEPEPKSRTKKSKSATEQDSCPKSGTQTPGGHKDSGSKSYFPDVPSQSPASTPAPASTPGSTSTSTPSVQPPAAKTTADSRPTEINGDRTHPSLNGHSLPSRPATQRRNSNARVRAPSTVKPKRNLSLEAFPSELAAGDDLFSSLKSPRLPSISHEKGARPSLKPASSTIPRPISQLSSAGMLDGVPLETMPPPKPNDSRPKVGRGYIGDPESSRIDGVKHLTRSPEALSSSGNSCGDLSPYEIDDEFERAYNRFMPQSLSRLNPEVIDLFCDILQDDSTAESHLFEPRYVNRRDAVRESLSHRTKPLRRRNLEPGQYYPSDLLLRWMMFIEQSFFYVLSDPRRLIRSFSKKGQLYDSQTLWYCMLRMSRVAPTVVIHSLWMATEGLFAPPASVQSLRSPTARLFPKNENSLSEKEAGMVLSICLHLLIAVAPVSLCKEELQDMSRIRSHGLILARNGSTGPSTKLCLAYNDTFSNELAIRLGRRLFAAITTRNYFKEMSLLRSDPDAAREHAESPGVLDPLFQQLDFLNADTMYMLHFSIPSRAVHEIRAPTLLLDWARSVMMHEWDGQPEVPADGSFGGALAMIKAMHHRRRLLVLADGQFRADYFAERLDEVEMPVSWLSFTSTKKKQHLLDYPFIFSPSKLVSYFRAINFSRMSRSFEESNSLQDRMSAIIPPRGSLIVNEHHKDVLHDMLKAASSKYLVLSISRDRVLEDTFDQLWRREERELMRPLKIKLGEGRGEEGFDSGGVQQEFFRIAMAEALNPDYGLFTVDDRTRMAWFNPGSAEPDWKFELIGLLFSLAVYNGLTLPVTFPEALYCKLLGEPVTELHHISDGWPELASGLTTMLDWDEKDGSVEDVFALTYEFSVSMFGRAVTREMKSDGSASWPCFPGKHSFGSSWWSPGPSGSTAPPLHEDNPTNAPAVTRDNRNAYASDYIRYLTDVSVRPQFEAFARGFRTCLSGKALSLLTPRLLRSVVEGVHEVDAAELRRHARYVGWDASHRSVRDFWAVVRRFDEPMRRRLLEFVTASDRVPVGGMKNVQFVVQRNGEEEGEQGRLPTAYTCYGILLLPEYRDREVLRERLCMALENAQGFGFA